MTPISSREARELQILNSIAAALNSAPDVRQALTRALALVADWLGLQTGWVWLTDPETGEFYNAAAQRLPPYLQEPVRMTGHSCWCIEQFRAGKLSSKNIDVLQCSRLSQARDKDTTHGLRYHASIPLYFQDKALGIMNVAGPSWRRLTADELRLLSTIANQVGIAIERARLAEESTRLARAEERTRIAREIHDTLAQDLTAIALHIEGALPHLESNPAQARERLQRALTTAREALEEARRSVLDLRAVPLAGKPLVEALSALARAFTGETGIRVQVQADSYPTLPIRIEAELYRIAQEALANVRYHAKATDATIHLWSDQRTVHLTIRDNGRGLERAKSRLDSKRAGKRRAGGQGLIGMKERAKLLKGTVRITSRAGQGTTVAVIVPLPTGQTSPTE